MKARTTGAYVLIALGAVATAVVVFSRGTALEAIFPAERASRSFSDKVWSRVTGACRGASASAENVALRREVAALALAATTPEITPEESATEDPATAPAALMATGSPPTLPASVTAPSAP